jgi:hypothetical protein
MAGCRLGSSKEKKAFDASSIKVWKERSEAHTMRRKKRRSYSQAAARKRRAGGSILYRQ